MPNAYADAALVKQLAGVTYADLGLVDDAALDALILKLNQRASAIIDREAGRDFLQHVAAVETLDGNDGTDLLLQGFPVLSIASVTDRGVALDSTGYRLKPTRNGSNAGVLQLADLEPWTQEYNRYVVTYTWGYTTPPLDVQQAAESMVIRALQAAKGDARATGATSWSMDGFSVTYDRQLRSFLSDAEVRAVRAYRVGA
jgi:hypothetical protein